MADCGGTINAHQIVLSQVILMAIVEITESRSAEMIRAVMESAMESVVTVDEHQNIVLVNAATEKMFGYTPEELIGKPLDLLIPEESRERHAEYHRAYVANAQSRPMGIRLELKALRKDGTTFPVEIGLNVIDTPQGRLGVAFVNDITERKRIEDLLRQKERELDTLLNDVPDAIARFDRDLRHTYVNERVEKLTGVPRENMIGKTPKEVGVPEQVVDLLTRAVQSVFESGQPVTDDASIPSPDGVVTHWESRFYPEFNEDGSVRSVLNIAREVTERKRLDDLLRHRERELDALLNNAPDPIVRFDRDVRYLFANAEALNSVGIPRENVLGKTPAELKIPQELAAMLTRNARAVFETGQPRADELSYPSKGGMSYAELRFIPEFHEDGSVRSVLAIGRDVTERKRMERAAEASRKEIRALAGRLLHAQEEERRRVSRELHDGICQQLAVLAIDMGVLAADANTADGNRERIRELQALIVKTSEEARHLAYELHPSVLDDLGLGVSLQALCDEFAQKEDVAVEFRKDELPDAIPLEVASGLYRIAQESLRNIAKYAEAKHVKVTLARGRRGVQLSIQDNGAGFDPEAVKGKGGLGLVSMQERARLIHGKLSIESSPGHGTRIELAVPLV